MNSTVSPPSEPFFPNKHGVYGSGDFYVEEHDCITCGVPAALAPDLIRHRSHPIGSCYFHKQPTSAAELEQAIAAVEGSCVCAVRYRGADPEIWKRLSDLSVDDSPARLRHLVGTDRVTRSLVSHITGAPQPSAVDHSPGFFTRLFRRSL